jgi:hypothetical protein
VSDITASSSKGEAIGLDASLEAFRRHLHELAVDSIGSGIRRELLDGHLGHSVLPLESAGIVLVRDDPRDVVGAIELSRASYRKMLQNLVWATGYNALAIPLAGCWLPLASSCR